MHKNNLQRRMTMIRLDEQTARTQIADLENELADLKIRLQRLIGMRQECEFWGSQLAPTQEDNKPMKIRILKAGEFNDWDAHTDHGHLKKGDVIEAGDHWGEQMVEDGRAEFVDKEQES